MQSAIDVTACCMPTGLSWRLTFWLAPTAADLPLARGVHALHGDDLHALKGLQPRVGDHVRPAVHEYLRLGCHLHLLHLICCVLHNS